MQSLVLIPRVVSAFVFDEQGGDELADAQTVASEGDIDSHLPLSCCLPNVGHHQLIDRLRCADGQVLQALASREILRSFMEHWPNTLREVFFQGKTRRLVPGPRVPLSFTEVLLSQEKRFGERGFGVVLGVADGLSCPEGALEGRSVDGSKANVG